MNHNTDKICQQTQRQYKAALTSAIEKNAF